MKYLVILVLVLIPVFSQDEEFDAVNLFPRQAYATLVTTPEYVIGAEVLAKMLKHFGSKRQMLALVSETLPESALYVLEDIGIITVPVPPVETKSKARYLEGWPHSNSTLSKLHLFGLFEDYDRIVYLDADSLPLVNLDHLFDVDLSNQPEHYPFAAAPEMMPPDTFNTGVMVIRPCRRSHEALLRAASAGDHDATDQEVLNRHFAGWYKQPAAHRLAFVYNVIPTLASYYAPAWDIVRPDIQVLHFAGDAATKPWAFAGTVSPAVGLYIYLWQSIARAQRDDDLAPLFDVLSLRDETQIAALFRRR